MQLYQLLLLIWVVCIFFKSFINQYKDNSPTLILAKKPDQKIPVSPK